MYFFKSFPNFIKSHVGTLHMYKLLANIFLFHKFNFITSEKKLCKLVVNKKYVQNLCTHVRLMVLKVNKISGFTTWNNLTNNICKRLHMFAFRQHTFLQTETSVIKYKTGLIFYCINCFLFGSSNFQLNEKLQNISFKNISVTK